MTSSVFESGLLPEKCAGCRHRYLEQTRNIGSDLVGIGVDGLIVTGLEIEHEGWWCVSKPPR